MPYIRTISGKKIELYHPERNTYDIKDIATSLSNQCRFNGHVKSFYSVAEHCVRLSYLADEGCELLALLHDAAEAYIGDLVHPLKITAGMQTFRDIDNILTKEIFKTFNVEPTLPQLMLVTKLDRAICAVEAKQLWEVYHEEDFAEDPDVAKYFTNYVIGYTMTPTMAYRSFLDRFKELHQ